MTSSQKHVAESGPAKSGAIEKIAPGTFPKYLLHHSGERGDRPAIREKRRGIWRTMTWRNLADEAAALAAALSMRGLERGAHVVLVGDNRPRLYAAMCATHYLGAVSVPLYQDFAADELIAPIQSSGATHIFAENQEQVDKLLKVLPQCPTVRCIVYDDDRGMRHYKQPQLISYDSLLREGQDASSEKRALLEAEALRISGQDPAFLFFTSGTTGPAKGAVFTHAALIDRARVAAAAEGLKDTDVALAYLPPGWIGQNLFSYVQSLVAGYCIACPESSETMLADMREVGPTYFLAPPRVLETLLTQVTMRMESTGGLNQRLFRQGLASAKRNAERALAGKRASIAHGIAAKVTNFLIFSPLRDVLGMSHLRVAYTGGDAVDRDLLMFFRAIGINVKQLYGSTETGFFVAMPSDGKFRPDTVGTAAAGVELKFTPQREILVRSPGLFKEYHLDSQATTQAMTADGWFHTGDAGYLDDSGQLRIIDRLKYVGALKDGTPYSPRLIENKLKFSPFIREAVVFGEGRDNVCVLIDIDPAAVGSWADKQSISYTGHADLASREEVYRLIAGVIADVNARLASDPAKANAQIHRFLILPKELDADDGVITRTGKLRREVVAVRCGPLVDAMFEGRSDASLEPEGGQAGTAWAELKIRDAKVVAPAHAKRAA